MAFETSGDGFSSVLSIILLVCSLLSILATIAVVYMYNRANKLEGHEFERRFGSIVELADPKFFLGRYWTSIILLRWFVTIVVIVCLRDSY